jgi:hypothetical protein
MGGRIVKEDECFGSSGFGNWQRIQRLMLLARNMQSELMRLWISWTMKHKLFWLSSTIFLFFVGFVMEIQISDIFSLPRSRTANIAP